MLAATEARSQGAGKTPPGVVIHSPDHHMLTSKLNARSIGCSRLESVLVGSSRLLTWQVLDTCRDADARYGGYHAARIVKSIVALTPRTNRRSANED
jgi:hypothetical protein